MFITQEPDDGRITDRVFYIVSDASGKKVHGPFEDYEEALELFRSIDTLGT